MLDIVIPVFNQTDLLAKCLDAIPAAVNGYCAYKVYISDDGSKNPTIEEFLDSYGMRDEFRVLKSRVPTNTGFPLTVNRGVLSGFSPIVLILNSDCVMQPDSVKLLIEHLENNSSIGVVTPLLLFPPDNRHGQPPLAVQHAGMAFDIFGTPLHLFLGWNPNHPKVARYRDNLQIATGACMLMKRELCREVGSFIKKMDKSFQGGIFSQDYGSGTYEDLELCFIIRNMGKKIVMLPSAIGHHYTGASIMATGQGYPMQRNEMIFKARWGAACKWDEYEFV